MDNIQLYYIDNEINKIDKMKQGDVIYNMPDGEFENLVERLFNEAKKNLL